MGASEAPGKARESPAENIRLPELISRPSRRIRSAPRLLYQGGPQDDEVRADGPDFHFGEDLLAVVGGHERVGAGPQRLAAVGIDVGHREVDLLLARAAEAEALGEDVADEGVVLLDRAFLVRGVALAEEKRGEPLPGGVRELDRLRLEELAAVVGEDDGEEPPVGLVADRGPERAERPGHLGGRLRRELDRQHEAGEREMDGEEARGVAPPGLDGVDLDDEDPRMGGEEPQEIGVLPAFSGGVRGLGPRGLPAPFPQLHLPPQVEADHGGPALVHVAVERPERAGHLAFVGDELAGRRAAFPHALPHPLLQVGELLRCQVDAVPRLRERPLVVRLGLLGGVFAAGAEHASLLALAAVADVGPPQERLAVPAVFLAVEVASQAFVADPAVFDLPGDAPRVFAYRLGDLQKRPALVEQGLDGGSVPDRQMLASLLVHG